MYISIMVETVCSSQYTRRDTSAELYCYTQLSHTVVKNTPSKKTNQILHTKQSLLVLGDRQVALWSVKMDRSPDSTFCWSWVHTRDLPALCIDFKAQCRMLYRLWPVRLSLLSLSSLITMLVWQQTGNNLYICIFCSSLKCRWFSIHALQYS